VAIIKHKKIIIRILNISNLYIFLEIQESVYMEGFPKSGHISMGSRIGGTGGTCPHKIYELLKKLVFNNRNVCCYIIVPLHF